MSESRRVGAKTSRTREQLLDAAETLLADEGYQAVTSRRMAAVLGVKPPLVYYYFPTMDDLFVALLRRRTDIAIAELVESLRTTEQPLRLVWEFASDKAFAASTTEFVTIAGLRAPVGAEMLAAGRRFRAVLIEAVDRAWAAYGLDPDEIPPAVVLFVLKLIPWGVAVEEAFGLDDDHADVIRFVERMLDRFEPL